MATYKGIQGYSVQKLSSDPTASKAVGQLWYNSVTGKFKIGTQGDGAWASGGSLNTARGQGANAGIQTAALWAGGEGFETASEEYDGTSWTEGDNLNTGRRYLAGTGTQTAALAFGGRTPPNTKVTLSEEYDGTSWAEGGDIPAALDAMSGCGTQTAALGIGGAPPVSNVANIYNGSTWTEVTNMPTASQGGAMSGIQTAALYFGGSPPGVQCDSYDGSSWTEKGSLSTGRIWLGGTPAGTSSLALAYGGGDGPPYNDETEEWTDPVYTIKTVTVS